MGLKQKRETLPTRTHFIISSLSVSTATVITHNIDVVKVHMQMESASTASSREAFSFIRFLSYYPKLHKAYGHKAFYSGMGAALFRSMTYGGARIGFYEPIRSKIKIFPNSINVLTASLMSGCFASLLGNPFEVIKVRMQSKMSMYANMLVAAHSILTNEGIWMFWRGLIPSMIRSSLLTASQIGPYSFSKHQIEKHVNVNDVSLHLISSLIAGIISTTVTSPADVIKTRVMNQHKVKRIYLMQFSQQMLKKEGFMSLFRGWMANYVRLGPQTTAIFVFYEQYCKLFNVDGF